MNRFYPVLSIVLVASAFACGGATNAESSASENEPAAEGTCTLAAGTYDEHFSVEPGGQSCPSVADQTISFDGTSAITAGTSGPADGGDGCTLTTNAATCSAVTSCNQTTNGSTLTLNETITFANNAGTGKQTTTISDASGQVISSCTYDITITKT